MNGLMPRSGLKGVPGNGHRRRRFAAGEGERPVEGQPCRRLEDRFHPAHPGDASGKQQTQWRVGSRRGSGFWQVDAHGDDADAVLRHAKTEGVARLQL